MWFGGGTQGSKGRRQRGRGGEGRGGKRDDDSRGAGWLRDAAAHLPRELGRDSDGQRRVPPGSGCRARRIAAERRPRVARGDVLRGRVPVPARRVVPAGVAVIAAAARLIAVPVPCARRGVRVRVHSAAADAAAAAGHRPAVVANVDRGPVPIVGRAGLVVVRRGRAITAVVIALGRSARRP